MPGPTIAQDRTRPGGEKTLVVYYSRTGTTEKLALAIAAAAGADVEKLEDSVNRLGVFGFVRSVVDAARRQRTVLKPLGVNLDDYDLVVVGTPDWGQSVSAPVRAFLQDNRERFRRVAFFLTDGISDHGSVFRDMATLAGRQPVATLGLPHDDVLRSQHSSRVTAFVHSWPLLVQPTTTAAQAH